MISLSLFNTLPSPLTVFLHSCGTGGICNNPSNLLPHVVSQMINLISDVMHYTLLYFIQIINSRKRIMPKSLPDEKIPLAKEPVKEPVYDGH